MSSAWSLDPFEIWHHCIRTAPLNTASLLNVKLHILSSTDLQGCHQAGHYGLSKVNRVTGTARRAPHSQNSCFGVFLIILIMCLTVRYPSIHPPSHTYIFHCYLSNTWHYIWKRKIYRHGILWLSNMKCDCLINDTVYCKDGRRTHRRMPMGNSSDTALTNGKWISISRGSF